MAALPRIVSGRKVVAAAGTAESLMAAPAVGCAALVLTAETDNTGYVVVGDSGVVAAEATRKGTPLAAGESMSLDIQNPSLVYLDVTVSGDGVTWSYLTS